MPAPINGSATSCELLLYADDAAIVYAGNNVQEIESVLSQELRSIQKWLEVNRLSLHLGKTESILFGSKKKLKISSKMNIACNGCEIQSKEKIKYLGLTFDQDMSSKSMGSMVF